MGELEDYFAAWNEPDRDRRSELLARAVTADVELIHPTWGRSAGVDALVEHIDGYRSALPETTVVLAIGTDGHNPVVRYAWEVVDRDGKPVLDGLDLAELTTDGRLRRILLFHGSLPVLDTESSAR